MKLPFRIDLRQQARRVVIVQVREKNLIDIADVDTGSGEAPGKLILTALCRNRDRCQQYRGTRGYSLQARSFCGARIRLHQPQPGGSVIEPQSAR